MSASSRISCLLFCSLCASPVLAQSADLQSCQRIDDDKQRLACYDQAVGRTAEVSPPEPVPAPEAPVTQPAADVDMRSPAPVVESTPAPAPVIDEQPIARSTPTPPADPAAQTESGKTEAEFGLREEPDWEEVKDAQITAAVVDVGKTAFGSAVIELDNNHVWQQIDSKRLTLRKGDEVTIRGGLGGSFYLAKTSGSRSLKVKRIK